MTARVPGSRTTDDSTTDLHAEPFVKLLRKFQRHRFWRERRRFSRAEAFIDMVFMAYYEPREIMWNGHAINLGPGEFMASEHILARRWRWSPRTAGRYLKRCERHGEVALNARDFVTQGVTRGLTHPGTHVTLCSYAEIHGQVTHPREGNVTQGVTHYKRRVVQENTTASKEPAVDNCGQLSVPAKCARVYEAFRLVTNSTKPPTQTETAKIATAIAENGGDWEPIRDTVRDATVRAVARAKAGRGEVPRSVRYGLAVWREQKQERVKVELGAVPADARVASLAGTLSKSLASPVQRRPDAPPSTTSLTPEERAHLDRINRGGERTRPPAHGTRRPDAEESVPLAEVVSDALAKMRAALN